MGNCLRWKVSEVATPKFPPPPCSAQNSSAFFVSSAISNRPSAVTSSTEISASHASPNFRSSHPDPPPRVSPATPVVDARPPVVASRYF